MHSSVIEDSGSESTVTDPTVPEAAHRPSGMGAVVSRQRFGLESLFAAPTASHPEGEVLLGGQGFSRTRLNGEQEILLDCFGATDAKCAALRFSAVVGRQLTIGVTGAYGLESSAAGGWLIVPWLKGQDAFWVPQSPKIRELDSSGHILSHRDAAVAGLDVSSVGLNLHLDVPPGCVLDLVVWHIPSECNGMLQSLQKFNSLEHQRYFLWSSHTAYERPADVYLHWVHGHVYENHEVWPKYWRVCSELDAYALYVILSGLLKATGKRIYELLRIQVVFSVIARQSADGGWYHGEWTDDMESHYRLHAGGMHMLAAYFEETSDPAAGAALNKAAVFAAKNIDKLRCGTWYLHDSLEQNTEGLEKYPFSYLPSKALGKSNSNLLVLNTHLDTNIAMARHRRVTGDERHADLIASAQSATIAVLSLRPADWLYRPLFWAISLTFLPTHRAKALSFPLRAIKRVAWKFLIPLLPRIKGVFPRLVMPGGYIERELTMFAFSVRYQPVNLMDLVRTRRLFEETVLDPLLEESFLFTHRSGIKDRWKELKGKEDDSLGFWAEALYHLALALPDRRFRDWLAEAMMDLSDNDLGLPPSLLGACAEAIAPDQQYACPSPTDARLRVANLSRSDRFELLVVNPTQQRITLQWENPLIIEVNWHTPSVTTTTDRADSCSIGPRAWVHGVGEHADLVK